MSENAQLRRFYWYIYFSKKHLIGKVQFSSTFMETVRSSFLRNVLLYFAISVLINICFFPTIQRYMTDDAPFAITVDSSLVEVIFENLLGFDDSDVNLAGDADDSSIVFDYLSSRACITIGRQEETASKGLPLNYDCPGPPSLTITTPPPKG